MNRTITPFEMDMAKRDMALDRRPQLNSHVNAFKVYQDGKRRIEKLRNRNGQS